MNNIKLITTEKFEDVIPCDFWNDANDEYLVTREQIGRALGYSNPAKAIDNIHQKHKERLNKFSTTLTLGIVEGNRYVERERILYSRKGIMEICRWSRQPKADEFMDWCWDIIDNLIANKANERSTIINTNVNNRLSRIEQMLTTITPPTLYSEWKTDIATQIRHIASASGKNTSDDVKAIYGDIYKTMRTEYGMPVDKYKQQYMEKHNILYNPYAIDIVDDTPELKELFTKILDEKYIKTTNII